MKIAKTTWNLHQVAQFVNITTIFKFTNFSIKAINYPQQTVILTWWALVQKIVQGLLINPLLVREDFLAILETWKK